jgi:hypothetical protein
VALNPVPILAQGRYGYVIILKSDLYLRQKVS